MIYRSIRFTKETCKENNRFIWRCYFTVLVNDEPVSFKVTTKGIRNISGIKQSKKYLSYDDFVSMAFDRYTFACIEKTEEMPEESYFILHKNTDIKDIVRFLKNILVFNKEIYGELKDSNVLFEGNKIFSKGD
jgi:hypothetical protein